MRISLVVAMTADRVIGRSGTLPWRLPADLRRFRRLTLGHPVIMGRKTHESIGKPLDGRWNIVLTRQRDYTAPGCDVVHTPDAALAAARVAGEAGAAPEAMIIGGAALYTAFLSRAERLYVTLVHARIEGDTYFPAYDAGAWTEVERSEQPPDAHNPHPCSFLVLERRET